MVWKFVFFGTGNKLKMFWKFGGVDQLKIVWKVGFQFFKSRFFAYENSLLWFQFFKNQHFTSQNRLEWFQYFSKSDVSHLKTVYYGWFQFFKSRRFAPQYLLQRFQFSQKLAIRAAKALFVVFWKTKHYEKVNIIISEFNLLTISVIKKHSEMLRINGISDNLHIYWKLIWWTIRTFWMNIYYNKYFE